MTEEPDEHLICDNVTSNKEDITRASNVANNTEVDTLSKVKSYNFS